MFDDSYYMSIALNEATLAFEKEEVPIGALIVHQGEIVSTAHNLCESQHDPTAHAELLAIQQCAQTLGDWRLEDVTLYVTKEPCPMCAGAILNARIPRLVYGCKDIKGGAVDSLYALLGDKRLNHQVSVTSGVLAESCSHILKRFFQTLRGKKSGAVTIQENG